MKIIYDPRYTELYASDPAAKSGRMEAIRKSGRKAALIANGYSASARNILKGTGLKVILTP